MDVDLYYPNDHGGGTRDINPNGPDWSFKRFVQDNDAALSLTVELLSHSKTHTSLASVFKTVNLILGLPPLNQYDAAATLDEVKLTAAIMKSEGLPKKKPSGQRH